PNRIFDYMQAGIPVIASDFPDIARIVNEHQTGLLIDHLNPKIIAETIRKACENLEWRRKWEDTLPQATQKLCWENEEQIIQHIGPLRANQE
ncbi:MAG: glycosyltransferase, partial [Bacteroidota bacterium]